MTISRDLGDRGHLPPLHNILINPTFTVNQRAWSSGGHLPSVGTYFVDRWCAATAGTTPTLSGITLTIPAGYSIKQIVEDVNIPAGTYNVSWDGTAQCDVEGTGLANSPVEFTVVGGSDITLEWGPGTLSKPMLVAGTKPAPFSARDYGAELALCQRYYQIKDDLYHRTPGNGSLTAMSVNLDFAVDMCAAPTITTTSDQLSNCSENNGWFHITAEGATYDVEADATNNTIKVQFGQIKFDAEL